jgi:hypothetical protein
MFIDLFIAQLRDKCPTLSGRVYGTPEAGLVQEGGKIDPLTVPVVYVQLIDEKADSDIIRSRSYRQLINVQMGLVVVVSNKKSVTTATPLKDIETIKLEIMQALCGWTPDGAAFPVNFTMGRREEYDDLTQFWTMVFSFPYAFNGVL